MPLRAIVRRVTVSSNYGRAASRPTRGRGTAIVTTYRGTAAGLGPKVADSEVFGLQARKQAHPRAEGQLARVPAHAPRAQACVAAAPPPRHVVRQPSGGGIQVVSRPLLSQEQRGVAVGGGWGGEQPQQLCVARRGGQRPEAVQLQGLAWLKTRYRRELSTRSFSFLKCQKSYQKNQEARFIYFSFPKFRAGHPKPIIYREGAKTADPRARGAELAKFTAPPRGCL